MSENSSNIFGSKIIKGLAKNAMNKDTTKPADTTPTTPVAPADKKKGMSKKLKIGLIVGGVLIVVIAGVLIYKHKHKKGK